MGIGPKIFLGVMATLLAVVLVVPVIAGLANQDGESAPAAKAQPDETAAQPQPSPGPETTPRHQQPQQPQQQWNPQQAPPQQWTRETLTGTSWGMHVPEVGGTITVTFQQGGTAVANTPFGPVQGNWRLNGNRITVSAMGESVTCYIKGWEIALPNGKHARRVR